MAIITPIAPTNAGLVMPTPATESGGDTVTYRGVPVSVIFRNGHTSSITVTIFPSRANSTAEGVGSFSTPARQLAIAAGTSAVFRFRPGEAEAYIDNNNRLPFTYTGHNAALLISAIEQP